MDDMSKIKMIERVTVAKFDHTLEDHPTVPVETIVQETVTEVSLMDAMLMGYVPKKPDVEATATVKIGDTA